MNKILGLITARGGSQSIPRKNIRILAGKPLIAWTIEAARQSSRLNRVIVSTDDQEIADVSRKWGAEVPFMRPSALAQDDTPHLPVIQQALSWLETREQYTADIIVILQPISPLRTGEHINQAISLFQETKSDSVVSVCLAEHSPYWMMRLEGNRVYPFLDSAPEYSRRQDLPPVHRINGAIYVTRRHVLMKENRILGEDTRAFVMVPECSIDIDTLLDLKIAEILMKEHAHVRL